jgi:hypothetical protein
MPGGGSPPARFSVVHVRDRLGSGAILLPKQGEIALKSPQCEFPPRLAFRSAKPDAPPTSALAMQKVEGSNPFSRFFANALHVGGLGSARASESNWNHPRICLHSRH